jgi:murein L,D-transpeptidase YcbB/YkuD
LLPLFLGLTTAQASAASLTGQVSAELAAVLSRTEPLRLGREPALSGELLPAFYAGRSHAPAWLDDLGPNAASRELLEALRGAGDEGLCPEDYHLRQIEPLLELVADSRRYGVLFHPPYLALLDLLFSDAFLRFAADLGNGRVGPDDLPDGGRAPLRPVDPLRLLRSALAEGRVTETLAALVPAHPGYQSLRAELQSLRRLSALGGWPPVPEGPPLRRGRLDPRLPVLRARLLLSGDLIEPAADGERFDAATEAALIRFQRRHGLIPDGVLGPKTLAALNVPVEARIRQVELNLERWRRLPRDLGRFYLLVNIADFRLTVVEEVEVLFDMPAVVGGAYRKTPEFSARLTHLIFAPYWNVPPTILREDKLPKIQADPGYLRRERFEIVRGWGENLVEIDPRTVRWSQVTPETFPGVLRQKPGKRNPLGKVKFIFPNPYDVYLHDTPDRQLFARESRTFSSGCIRIERPFDLACYLLRHQGWDSARVEAAMARQEPLQVNLSRPAPVHVIYRTAWVDESGVLQLRPDVYLRDLDLELALERRKERDGLVGGSANPGEAGEGFNP